MIPKKELETQGIAKARSAVLAQLVSAAAKANGMSPSDPLFKDSGKGASLKYVLDAVPDHDLTFALNRSFGQYQLLAGKPSDETSVLVPGAGLKFVDADQVQALKDVKGVALANGIPRDDVAGDFTARAAGLLESSQCDEYSGIVGQLFGADLAYKSGFQDSFAIGQALGRRLVLLRESAIAAGVTAFDGAGGTTEQAVKAAAEVRAWSGPGRMAATTSPGSGGGVDEIWVLTTGLEPTDLAVDTASEMGEELVLVHGPAWAADCAARTRANCPPGFEADYVVSPTSAVVSDGPGLPPDWRALTGSDGTVGLYIFPGSNGVTKKFNPTYITDSTPGKHSHLYVVARHDPLGPNERGRVLGTIALRAPFGGTGMPISWMQQKLLNDVLGVSNKWRDQAGRIGVGSTSTSPAYCIKGVPKDLFVPLENELTSDSDQYENSWKHYLSLAKQAALKADELGQKLIDIGLQQDFRREAAGEALANICGDFSALDEIKIENGIPSAPDGDQSLNDCLNERKYDLVLLTNDPAQGLSDTERTKFIKEKVLDCGSSTKGLCGKANINYAAMNLATFFTPDTTAPSECALTAELATSLKTGFIGESAKAMASASWASSAKMRFLAARLQVYVDPANPHWELRLSGIPQMSSAPQKNLWPGCRRSGQGCTSGTADLYDKLFRRAAVGSELGSGLDGFGSDAEREANLLLWRVEGAAWMIGAMGGTIPEKMFDVQIPAANFNALEWGSNPSAPVFTVLATGKFEAATKQLAAPVAEQDRAIVGAGATIPGSFWWPITPEVPDWLSAIYSPPSGRFLHVRATNPEIEGFGSKNLSSWLDQQLTWLSGIKCEYSGFPKFEGSPLGPSVQKHLDGLKAVSALRAGSRWGQICQNGEGTNIQGMKALGGGSFNSVFRDVVEETASPVPGVSCDFPSGHVPLYPLSSPDSALGHGCFKVLQANEADSAGWNTCQHSPVVGIHAVSASCAESNGELGAVFSGPQPGWGYRYTNRMLLPRACSPGSRAQVFVNSYPAPGVCGAGAQLAQALALACQYNVKGLSGGGVGVTPPTISKLEHLDGFVEWIGFLEASAREQVGRLYVEKVPKKVVDDYAATKVGTGVNKGEHGAQLLELRKALETMGGAWNRAAGDVAQLRLAVDAARIAIVGAGIDQNMTAAQLAIQQMQIHAGMLSSVAGAFNSVNPAGIVAGTMNAGAQLGLGGAMLQQTEILEKLSQEKNANQVQAALNQLQLTSNPIYTDLQNSIGDIRSATATAISINNALQQSESQAKYEAAKGSGADFVIIDGKPVKFPVNTVQNRLYDTTRLRYLAALEEAKYLAYVARLAIEQRIGQRLSTIDTPVGPIEAPSAWADDVCSLTGIDYEQLRAFDTDAGAGADGGVLERHFKDIIAEFADQYIADYVDKLGNFVEYYNIAYPSHDGDDTAVLSLKDDLLGPIAGCVKEGPNLLYYSSSLGSFDVLDEAGVKTKRGWEVNACGPTDGKCLRVATGAAMKEAPAALPIEAPVGGVTWLYDEANPLAAAPPPDGGAPLPTPSLPPRTVSQAVSLVAGSTYVLSWWDQARAADGSYLASGAPVEKYRVAVLAPDGQQIKPLDVAPHNPGGPTGAQQWSARQSLDFKATESGTYRVLFGASFEGPGHGSVAIANVQLEQGAPGSSPSAYVNTGSSRQYLSPECTGKTPEDVQKAFRHVCDATKQCYYELVAPIVVDTNGLASGKSRLNGKLAAGNFNFRHITLAVNLVGTGIYDCTANPSQSCFGSAFIEYTLDHDAFQAGVIGWNGNVQTFNFGSAGINHGKALTAEKYITLPIGSGDQNLLAQPGIEKPEYRGRPLDGSYRLRIWDSPYLMWNRLEDIQVILKYRYWSKIQPQPAP